MLKQLIDLYFGSLCNIKDHINQKSSIAELLSNNIELTRLNREPIGDLLELNGEYEGYIGQDLDKEDLPIFIAGVAEMVAKVLLIRRLGFDEQEVYSCLQIKEAIGHLGEYMNNMKLSETKKFMKFLGRENVVDLITKLDNGYVYHFEIAGDSIIERAVWLFCLLSFHKFGELRWFKYRSCIVNFLVKEDVRKIAKKIYSTFRALSEDKEVIFFPKYGINGKLTSYADIQIGDSVYIISALKVEDWTEEILKSVAIRLNACAALSLPGEVKHRYIYHVRWGAFTKVA